MRGLAPPVAVQRSRRLDGSRGVATALGADVGERRIGLAATDPTGSFAFPVATLARTDARRLWERIRAEAELRGAAVLVVGLPRTLDGTEGPAAAAARVFAEEAARKTGLQIELWDERLSTVEAERLLRAAGVGSRERRQRVDAVAAALVLEAWLRSRGRGPASASGTSAG